MSNDVGSALKSNWYLIVAAVAFVVVGIVAAIVSGGDEEDNAGVVVQQAGNAIEVVTVDDDSGGPKATTYRDQSSSDVRASAIAELERQLDEDPNAREAPDRMRTLITLYVTERDYDSAIAVGEEFVQRFPDHDDVLDTLGALASMYEELNESSLAQATYQRIMDRTTPDSPQYKSALQSLENLDN